MSWVPLEKEFSVSEVLSLHLLSLSLPWLCVLEGGLPPKEAT